jgi:hypothetical protein
MPKAIAFLTWQLSIQFAARFWPTGRVLLQKHLGGLDECHQTGMV